MAENQGCRRAGRTVCGASGVLSGSPGLTQTRAGLPECKFQLGHFLPLWSWANYVFLCASVFVFVKWVSYKLCLSQVCHENQVFHDSTWDMVTVPCLLLPSLFSLSLVSFAHNSSET